MSSCNAKRDLLLWQSIPHLLELWRLHVIRRRVLERISSNVKSRILQKSSPLLLGREVLISFGSWKKEVLSLRKQKRGLAIVDRCACLIIAFVMLLIRS